MCFLRSKFNSRYFFSFFSENVGVKKLGFIAFKKVPDRYGKLREAERKISSNFGPKRMVGFRVMTKKTIFYFLTEHLILREIYLVPYTQKGFKN